MQSQQQIFYWEMRHTLRRMRKKEILNHVIEFKRPQVENVDMQFITIDVVITDPNEKLFTINIVAFMRRDTL